MNVFAVEGRVMLKDNPKAQAYFERGVQRAQTGDLETALSDFTTVIALVPNFADAYYRRGYILLCKGDTHNCLLDYQTALRLAPTHPNAPAMRETVTMYGGTVNTDNISPFVDDNAPFVDPFANNNPAPTPPASNGGMSFTDMRPRSVSDSRRTSQTFPTPQPRDSQSFRTPAQPQPGPRDSQSFRTPPMTDSQSFRAPQPPQQPMTDSQSFRAPAQPQPNPRESQSFQTPTPDWKRQTNSVEMDDSPSQGTRPNMTAEEHLQRGIMLFEDQLLNGAARNFERAVQLNPMLVEGYVNLGVVYHAQNNLEKARIAFKKALELQPNHPDAETMRAIVSGNFVPGEEKEAEPRTSKEYVARAVRRVDRQDFKGAREDFEQAIKLDPKNDEAYFQKGNMHVEQISHRSAVSEYDKALKLNPKHAEALFNRGISRHALEDYKGAIADFTELSKLEPRRARAYFHRGMARMKTKEFKQAIDDFTKAIQNDPKNASAYSNRGLARLAIKEFGGARDDYDRAIEIDPVDREAAALLIGLKKK